MKKTIRFFTSVVILALTTHVSFAQNYRIHGTVSDDVGEPVPFASVYIDATSYGTTTDNEGSYELLIPRGLQNVELITSLVGYETKKTAIEIGKQKSREFNITLRSIILDEAIVAGKMDRF
ncbi:MAG: putative membrane protein [Spirosomataceae bacterium]|jgi:uncharacterized membrane protein